VKKLFVLSLMVLGTMFLNSTFVGVANAEPAAAKKVVNIHLVYAVGSTTWSPREISDAYKRANLAVSYWNKQSIPVELRIADTSVQSIDFDTLNWDQASARADALNSAPGTVYLVRDPMVWAVSGFARKGQYAVVAYDGRMAGVLAHELGHVLGADDRYFWNGTSWGCQTSPDIMCVASLVTTLSQQTLSEINGAGW
jgi:hypothetical protein